jgi:16S rRNA (guanine1207-N2)-methyltransferase
MAHYFTNEILESKEKTTKCIINNHEFTFITDNGVFSKKGLDFGTRTLLETLDIEHIKGNVLDFGCGYGPIGIYISKIKNIKVDMIDINLRSIQLAKKNSLLNEADTNVFYSNLYENVDKKYDFIISNPPIRVGKKILYEILFKAKDYLNLNGEMWIVINKDQGAKSVMKDLEKIYNVELINKNKGFYIIKAKTN